MGRLPRAAASFFIVLGLYWAYALAAVPLIEPRAAKRVDDAADTYDSTVAASQERRLRELEGLFPPGSWQLTNPKILETGQIKVLLQHYRNLGDGRIEFCPCSMIQMPEGASADDPQQRRRAIVLDAPDGAVLQFDKAIELRRAEVGRLVAGQLRGTVIIRSEGRSAGPEDDLRIVTQDIDLTEREVRTEANVDFNFGPNSGSGNQMRIRLSQGNPGKKSGMGPNIGGLESFELKRAVKLHLEPRRGKPGADAKAKPAVAGGKFTPNELPVDITCDGPFYFEMEHRAATFRDKVVVFRHDYTGGPSDEVTCDLLTIYFEPRKDRPAKSGPDGQPALTDLEARRIEARGTPVNVLANTQQAKAVGDRIVYDLVSGELELDSAAQACLSKGNDEIRSRSFKYHPDPSGKLGQLEAKGPGALTADMRDRRPHAQQAPSARAPQQVHAEWLGELRVRPDEQNQLISLTGGAEITMPQLGQLKARDIHFWIKEREKAGADGNRYVPDRMRAEHDVHMQSPQMSGSVQQMEVWFVPPGTDPKRVADAAPEAHVLIPTGMRLPPEQPAEGGPEGPMLAPPGMIPGPQQPGPGAPPIVAPAVPQMAPPVEAVAPQSYLPVGPQPPVAGAPALQGPPQRYHVQGRLLRARLILNEPQTEIAELFIIDDVRLTQLQSDTTEEKPLLVTGDQIQALKPNDPAGTISVIGRPAHFEWHGLGLTGLNINLNRGANRLWVDGPGNMDVPMRQGSGRAPPGLAGGNTNRALAPGGAALLPAMSGSLNVRWHESMNFSGQTAVFQNMVTAEAPERHLETETLEVVFRQPIRFDQAQARQQPEVEELHCLGGVWMESSTSQAGQQATLERAEFKEVQINMTSGDTAAAGPGWLARVARPSAEPRRSSDPTQPGAALAGMVGGGGGDPNALNALLIRFQGQARGNIHRREITFYDRIQACYGPVPTWDATPDLEHPERLGPRGAVLHCEELAVVEMPNPADGQMAAELEARRNVIVESQSYTARGQRVAYAQAKDLLILQGDGRTDARLYREPTPADPRPGELVAQRIWFWPTTPNRVYVEKARSLELNQFSNRK
jgi:hypothetical protein